MERSSSPAEGDELTPGSDLSPGVFRPALQIYLPWQRRGKVVGKAFFAARLELPFSWIYGCAVPGRNLPVQYDPGDF